MVAVKLYGMGAAVCVQRVMHCLVEKSISFDIIHVDLDKLEHKRPHYLAKQPFGQVPYIEDGDLTLYESRAIIRYYAAKYAGDGPDLAGATLEEKARVDQWLDVEAINFNPLVFPIVFNLFLLPLRGGSGDSDEAAAATEKLEKVLDVYEDQLSKSKYLAGDEFTLADLSHIPATWLVVEKCGLKKKLIEEREHVKAWWEDISNRPAWKKVMSMVEAKALSFSP